MESVLALLEKLAAVLGSVDGSLLAGLAIVAEIVLRAIPSDKPRGLIVLAGDALGKLGALLVLVDQTIDKVVPQKTVAPSKKK